MLQKYHLLGAFFITFSVFSQQNFIKGTIKNKQGETINGFINYLNWKQNPQQISFKENLTSTIKIFSPRNLYSFNVADDFYISKNVTIDRTTRMLQDLPNKFLKKNEKKEVFLKLIFDGDKPLYYYEDKDGKTHFYIKSKEAPLELIYKVALINSKKVERKAYRNQLFKYLSDCVNMSSKITEVQYKKNDLIKLFKNYHKCTDKEIKYVEKKEKIDIDFYPVLGLVNTNLSYSIGSASGGPIDDDETSTNFFFGGALELTFPRNRRRNSIYTEVIYHSVDFEVLNITSFRPGQQETNEFDFSFSYIKISNAYRLKFSSKKIEPFLSLGIINTFGIKREVQRKRTTMFFDTERVFESTIDTFKQNGLGLLFGGGIKINRLSLEARYETARTLQLSEAISLKNQNIFFIVGYSIF